MTEQLETALIHVRPDADPRIAALYCEGLRLQEYAEALVIQSDDDIKSAANDLSTIAQVKKAIEEQRKAYTTPINEHLKTVNDMFKAFTEPMVLADKIMRDKVLAFRSAQERQRQEQERINRLREEAAAAEIKLKGTLTEPVGLIEVAPAAPTRYQADTGALGKAKVWRFEVVDFSQLPNDYKMPDMVKIRKVVIAGVTIPGVRAWQEESLRVTSK